MTEKSLNLHILRISKKLIAVFPCARNLAPDRFRKLKPPAGAGGFKAVINYNGGSSSSVIT